MTAAASMNPAPLAEAASPTVKNVSAVATEITKTDAMNDTTPATPAAAVATARYSAGEIITSVLKKVLPPVVGFALLIGIWAIVASRTQGFPGPVEVWHAAVEIFSDPFYRNGPNDQGIGWNILSSLQRVGIGFGFAALVGIPMGFAIGRFDFLNRALDPIISLLRPVSPLAWLPIGLLVFKKADPAATWTIFICSIWPMIINTAVGVTRVPQDYMNVARVLNLSEFKIITKILFPAVLPYMLTGIRLSIGTAWLVIVAAEMLTGGVGIGFWVWDEWNNLKVEHIVIAIFVIGIVGLLLEQMLLLIAKKFSYGNT
ncbi:MAG: nitrate ABC transporter permease [Moraxellaceae bacterium]|nr:nitrate ABC transporter permease [Moraxellaceae bacterium]